MTLRQCFLTALLLFLITHIIAQNHQSRLETVDVQHYIFSLALNDRDDTLRGQAEIKVLFRRPVREWELDLVKASAGGSGMTVREVRENGLPLAFEHRQETLSLRLNQKAKAGESRTYQITYSGEPVDGLIIGRNKHGDRTFFGDNWPDRARHWLPCVDHPSDKATVEFVITAPEHYQVVANGYQVEESNLPDQELKLTHWSETVPLPTKVMVIGAAPFAVQYLGEINGVPLSSWIFPQDRKAGFHDYAQAREVLEWFTEKVAPYPYEKLANVQSKTRYGGMENASNIFYYENSVTGDRDQETLIAHEIAHQWFGNSASEANWHHVWLSEGFATYFTDLYLEGRYGRERMVANLKEERSDVLSFPGARRSPVVDTTITDYNNLLTPNVYPRGAWVLHMLRRELGDELFWKGIHAYYDRFRFSNALTADFQKVMEEISGKNLDLFFRQWLFTPGFPLLNAIWSYDKKTKNVVLTLEQRQEQPPFRFPLDIELRNAAGEPLLRETLAIDQRRQEFRLPLPVAPASLELDPDTWLLYGEK